LHANMVEDPKRRTVNSLAFRFFQQHHNHLFWSDPPLLHGCSTADISGPLQCR